MSTNVMTVPVSIGSEAGDVELASDDGKSTFCDGFDDRLVRQLTERARLAGVSLTGQDGLLKS